jgi:hypothetical protein
LNNYKIGGKRRKARMKQRCACKKFKFGGGAAFFLKIGNNYELY